ncbi:methionine ABC transporter ATP-binding protein [Carnobacterium divergens]|uniref:methionine ABC transporter ATP-binding protein n=1 Tax=Carnobacterium divergens TaxID=2748 RepID=UPI001072536C|nr:ATP-binding cassette domain-containing protein [Carnobacterium divergens]TFJ46982.1 methionine ABC transporter ATP-binding protein [Carnobacterium divergens]TFJ53946.1 methionine ABC transporter ATP-binding protein [Carnobacterium divergens]
MIQLEQVSVTFKTKDQQITAVEQVDLTVEKGDVFGIVGYSGAGKSTLVRTINLLQRPTSGKVIVADRDLLSLTPKELRRARKKIGMIFQHFNLMASRTIADNVAYPLKHSSLSKKELNEKVSGLLELVGLSDKHNAYPSQLSGGQKQRVAIARALANDPEVLLCDEATSALDPKTTSSILTLLKELNRKLNLTIVIITHEMQVVKEICTKVAIMEKGRVVEEGNLVQIFTQPRKPITKDFINTATHVDQGLETILTHPSLLDLQPNDILAKVSYVGATTSEPLIAHLYSQFTISTNILFGNIEILQDTPIGNLIVIFSGEKIKRDQALAYLVSKDIKVEIIEHQQNVISLPRKQKIS